METTQIIADYPGKPDAVCPCSFPGFCPHYGKNLVGRLWQLAKMDDDLGRQYRRLWAGQPASEPASTPAGPPAAAAAEKRVHPCQFQGANVLAADGRPESRACG